ncbi:regulator SirB [Hahella sp. KA22]|uniref:SirB2 family protein n=1 Tax=Hahella sp. KA22 TaxID=1628392 RepID=UPI000FDE5883|nr:SirB2 family protein [Hahella sp. KA22]AZZ90936.1 regulator SirB [Hahella sp. KA22]QAY54306.1 regulator SirB [Hahella sp. KA22]
MSYMLLKHIHMTCVALTFASFTLRFIWMILESPLLQRKLSKILPHIIDTVLLLSAIGLALKLQQYPFHSGWLTAKVAGLIIYIALGVFALKRGKTKGARILFGLGAYTAFAYIVMVALTKSSWPLPL